MQGNRDRTLKYYWGILSAVIALTGLTGSPAAGPTGPLNVLFIVADDQGNSLGCYGDAYAKTPHLDKLAAQGILFKRAYCQSAICGPSRASILTGLRPDTIKVYDLQTRVRKHLPGVLTLPEDFRYRGYFTQAFGKIFHPNVDDPQSWSATTFPGPEIVGSTSLTSGTIGGPADVTPGKGGGHRGPSWFAPDLPDGSFHDGVVTDEAIQALNRMKDKPFFLAVGYNRPHLPFVAPKKFFDQFKGVEPPVARNNFPPAAVPGIALTDAGELRQYCDIPSTGPLSEEKVRELTLAYYASSSFMDSQVGRLLDELKRLDLDDDTVVVFCGDHGFQLGENSIWAKNTNFEVAAKAPLIFRVPGGKTSGTVETIVEFVDVYPTLAEICGWTPGAVQGKSLMSHLAKSAAIGKPGMAEGTALSQVERKDGRGYSLRTDRYRYTEWRTKEGQIIARELYDHKVDPGENRSIAHEPASEAIIKKMHGQINDLLSAHR